MRFSRTLRFRITVWYCGTLALVMLVLGSLMYGIVGHRQMHHHDEMLAEKATQIQSILKKHDTLPFLTPTQIEAMDHLGAIMLVCESGTGQQVYYESPQMHANPLGPALGALDWTGAEIPAFATLSYRHSIWRLLSWHYTAQNGCQSVIRLMDDLDENRETLRHLRFAMLLLIPAAIVCSAIGGFWLSGRALAPVDQIARMAREIEASKLDQRLPHPGVDDEIGRLVVTLNRMIERLQGSFDAMKRFTADAAHELRNPLAIMRNTIDVVMEQPRTMTEQRAAMESLGEDVDRLRKIVQDLLLLAKADNGPVMMEREPVRLDNLVLALGEIHQPWAQEHGLTLDVNAPVPAVVNGNERWLYQLVGNLLDNALKFTCQGGKVQLEALPVGDTVRIRVQDTGPGIPEEDLGRIFERFYQVDPSRTRAHKPGSGLGLAIAAWIVASHGGRISAANHPGGGAVFTVELPTNG